MMGVWWLVDHTTATIGMSMLHYMVDRVIAVATASRATVVNLQVIKQLNHHRSNSRVGSCIPRTGRSMDIDTVTDYVAAACLMSLSRSRVCSDSNVPGAL